METITFNAENQKWVVRHIQETNGIIRDLGWSHFAAVSRPKGTKVYYANLFIVNGEILKASVVC